MLDEVAVVAIDAVSSDAVVNGCRAAAGVVVHVTLRVRRNFLGPSRRGTLPVPYRSSNLAVARSTVCPWLVALLLLFTADDDGFWNIGRRGVFTMLAQLSSIVGDSPSREETPSGRGERKAGLPERAGKVGASWAGRPSLDGHVQRRRVIALRDLAKGTDVCPCTALSSAGGESRSRYAMGGVAGCFEFGTLLSKCSRGIAWVADGIGGIRR